MLAIRGNAKVCLVAHTDVCRDHELLKADSKYGGYGEYSYWMQDRHDEEDEIIKHKKITMAEPVIKEVETEAGIRRIIQDKDCKLQVGGDDRLGVAINTWIALNTGYPMGLFFPTDEETGLKSSRMCEIPQLMEFDLCAQVDRGNHSDELVIKIGGEPLAGYDTATRLLNIAYKNGHPRTPVTGGSTDVVALRARNKIKEAVNMTCGYHNSWSAGSTEFIDIDEARETMRFCSEIVKDYYIHSVE
jgi:hypothetical protein